ncbi:threonine/serine exporter family protein [Corynebacterium afermentans]|nr:threonine/serine exporter family protein [Corynebacterium afermentans]MCG7273966.1 threonine/serine exporter family protein [Corynebacterium afermentans]
MIEPNPGMDAEANTCLRFGVLLLSAGASGYRVIRAVKRCARSVGFDEADVIVGFNTISCTFHRGLQFRTVVSDVPLPGVNASRIEALETAAHSLLQSYRTPEVIDAVLDEIERIPSPRWGLCLSTFAAGLACAGFAVLNQFGLATAALVCLAAMLGQLVRAFLHKAHFNLIGITMAASFVASSAFLLLDRVLPLASVVSPGFIAAVLFLIPGFPLFTSFVDLARFDFTAGIPRLFFALEIIVVIMLTVSVVAMLSGTPELPSAAVPTSAEFMVTGALASFVSVGCFALLLNSSRRMALIAATLGMAANVARLALLCGRGALVSGRLHRRPDHRRRRRAFGPGGEGAPHHRDHPGGGGDDPRPRHLRRGAQLRRGRHSQRAFEVHRGVVRGAVHRRRARRGAHAH